MMDTTAKKVSLRKKPHERRTLPRTAVLWTGVITTREGQRPFDCIIRNIHEEGAEISSKKAMQPGEQVYLVVPRNEMAYLGTVAWVDADRAGLSFSGTYELNGVLPPDTVFLKYALVQTKLRQVLALVQQGVSLADAAKVVGWREEEMDQLGGPSVWS
jgi:hypothetical protein